MRLINRTPSPALRAFLVLVPFALAFVVYLVASEIRLEANPSDRLLPSPGTILDTAVSLLTVPDRRSGAILFWGDTWASLTRLSLGVGLAAAIGLVFGMLIGLLPHVRATLSIFVGVLSLIPPLALLPILFITFGLGEVSKVVLIVIGITPFLIRDLSGRVMEIPREMIVKAETLGASSLVIALRVALPQVLPRLVQAIRLSLGPAWLFLIAAEAIAANQGLGYRIFLVRRYLAMDVILTYVLWITFLAWVIDWLLKAVARRAFPWTEVSP
ncbi:MAG: ABC transporter permease subunit [Rhodobacteraceae bacterium]|nr:ABC transporter permease subunit [Paracoccaceae bacterium]